MSFNANQNFIDFHYVKYQIIKYKVINMVERSVMATWQQYLTKFTFKKTYIFKCVCIHASGTISSCFLTNPALAAKMLTETRAKEDM